MTIALGIIDRYLIHAIHQLFWVAMVAKHSVGLLNLNPPGKGVHCICSIVLGTF